MYPSLCLLTQVTSSAVYTAVQIFTPLQYSRAIVYSGPHNIDAMAIATCLEDELKAQGLTEPHAVQQLAAKAPAYRAQALLEFR